MPNILVEPVQGVFDDEGKASIEAVDRTRNEVETIWIIKSKPTIRWYDVVKIEEPNEENSYKQGYKDGFNEGKEQGEQKGLEDGYAQGEREGYKSALVAHRISDDNDASIFIKNRR